MTVYIRRLINESTAGADASVEALKLYHMLSLLAAELALYKKWEMIDRDRCYKSICGRALLMAAADLCSFTALLSLLQLPIASVLVQN